MSAVVSFDLDRLLKTQKEGDAEAPQVSYWTAENHRADAGNTYLRLEEWMKDLQDYVLPVRQTASSIDITLDMGRALLRYREELKMFAAIHNQDHPDRLLDALEDVDFLQARHQAIKTEWPLGKETAQWWKSLEQLMARIDEAIARVQSEPQTGGVFIKLSVRSPKDSATLMPSYRQHLRDFIDKSVVAPDSPFALGDDVAAIRQANWLSTCCQGSEDALLLLVRSDRAYLDIQHHELYCEGDKSESFHLQLHVTAFFRDFDPAFEFRGFVSKGQRTALTMYNPWVYDERLIAEEEAVLQKMLALWDEVAPKIRSENYSLDFAFSSDLQRVWIVELNNFLPPLAGSGLFKFHEDKDKTIILEGPFEFRVRKTPVVEADFSYDRVDRATGKTLHVTMQPATDEIMLFVRNLRREKFGLPLLDAKEVAEKKKQPHGQEESKRKSCIIS